MNIRHSSQAAPAKPGKRELEPRFGGSNGGAMKYMFVQIAPIPIEFFN
jgi:hypothetical protein